MTTADNLRELIEPIAADLGVDLFDLEFGGSQLKVTLDRPGGIDMQAVAAATRAISRALDEADPIAGTYTLEVSSPGLERALRTPAHFAWAVGQQVAVKTVPTFVGERRIRGTIVRATDDHVLIETDAVEPDHAPAEPLALAYDDIDKARTVFEWRAEPKPGSGARSRRGRAEQPAKTKTKTKRAKAS
jgi:ribosome maturation factor RimP